MELGFSVQPPATWSHHQSSLCLYFPFCTAQPSKGDARPTSSWEKTVTPKGTVDTAEGPTGAPAATPAPGRTPSRGVPEKGPGSHPAESGGEGRRGPCLLSHWAPRACGLMRLPPLPAETSCGTVQTTVQIPALPLQGARDPGRDGAGDAVMAACGSMNDFMESAWLQAGVQ